jgi:crossover junction endodeoxyribonuclease RuvC
MSTMLQPAPQALSNVPADPALVMGIDPSLTGCGIGIIQHGALRSMTLAPEKGVKGTERLNWFFARIGGLLARNKPALVVLEGYAHGAKFGREALGELGGVLRLALWQRGVPFRVAQPSSLKFFATGKGAAEKPEVAKGLLKAYGVDCTNNDETDAAGLALIALEAHVGGLKLTQAQRKALEKLSEAQIGATVAMAVYKASAA